MNVSDAGCRKDKCHHAHIILPNVDHTSLTTAKMMQVSVVLLVWLSLFNNDGDGEGVIMKKGVIMFSHFVLEMG